jgi:hypothetical protein
MMLKLMLILAFLLLLGSTEWGQQAGNTRRVPFFTVMVT